MHLDRLHLIMGVHCNARCVMCYQTSFSRDLAMPPEIYQEHLRPLYPLVKTVKLQGGEPTIMRNCKEFSLLARDYPNLKLSITTNGIHLSDFWLETLVHQGRFVNFSLNAARKESYDKIVKFGNFTKAVGNIQRLVNARQGGSLAISMSMIILPANVRDIAEFLRLGISLGMEEINYGFDPLLSFRGLPPKPELRRILDEAFEILAQGGVRSDGLEVWANQVGYPVVGPVRARLRARCPLPFQNLVVDERGDVRVCCNTWVVVGNTYEQSIEQIVNGKRMRRFQQLIMRDNYKWCDPKCTDNPQPHRLAMMYKYLDIMRKDPRAFAGKVKAKLIKRRQL